MANLRWYRRGWGTAPPGTLEDRPYLAGDVPSIVDLSASAYVFLGAEAGRDPAHWPAFEAWLDRIRTLPGWVGQYTLMAR
jgi:glutathione S-transferase